MGSLQEYVRLSKVRLGGMHRGVLRLSLPFRWPRGLEVVPPCVYLYQHHTYVPYRVARWEVSGYGVVFGLVDMGLLVQAYNEVKGCDAFLSGVWLRGELGKRFSLDNLVFCEGFRVMDEGGVVLGEVGGVQPRGVQPLLWVKRTQQEDLDIPVHARFILGIDMQAGVVRVSWPPRGG